MEKSNCNKDIYKEHRLTVPCHQGKQFQDKKNLRNIIQQDTTRTNRNQTELPGRKTNSSKANSSYGVISPFGLIPEASEL